MIILQTEKAFWETNLNMTKMSHQYLHCKGWNGSWILDIFQGFCHLKNWKLINMSSNFIKNIWKKIFFWKIQQSKNILSNTIWLFTILGFYISFLARCIYWEDWPCGSRCCERIRTFLVQIPLDHCLGSET